MLEVRRKRVLAANDGQRGSMVLGGRKVSHCEMHLCPASAIDLLVLSVDSACLFESKHTASRSSGYWHIASEHPRSTIGA
jgi:hypothetical protein